MTYLSPTALGVSSIVILWVIYLAYTALIANWETLRIEVKIVGGAVVAVGWVLDVFLNGFASFPLWELPNEWTLSQRMGRLKRNEGWRQSVACYFCRVWLDPFSVGGHCR